jgi:arylsulfatase A-like enzyme
MASLFIGTGFIGISAATAETRQPNVVVFLVDDQGFGELVCYASKFHETPNIDALAANGMRFTHAYSGATLCSPSRAALLAGRSPARLHLTDWIPGQPQINRKSVVPDWQHWIDRERILLPEAMKEQNYATCFLGKWHLIARPKEHLDGVDIMPLPTGTGSIKDRPLYWHYPHYDETTPYSSAIVGGWKVVRYADDGKVELYELNNNPMEKKDLAKTNQEKAKSLIKNLDDHLTEVDAQLAMPNPDYDPNPNEYSGGIRG